MSSSSAASIAPYASPLRRTGLRRSALIATGTISLLFASPHSADAQSANADSTTWEVRVSSGAFVPAGTQRHFLKDAHVTAAQASWLVRPSLAVTGTFGWARSRDISAVDSPKLDVFTTDIGVEARPAQWFAHRAVSFSPFVGLGAGARTYNYRKLDVAATNNPAGYGSAGGELGIGRVGVRIEARNYITGFRPLVGPGRSDTRNDVVMMAAVRFDRHAAKH